MNIHRIVKAEHKLLVANAAMRRALNELTDAISEAQDGRLAVAAIRRTPRLVVHNTKVLR